MSKVTVKTTIKSDCKTTIKSDCLNGYIKRVFGLYLIISSCRS